MALKIMQVTYRNDAISSLLDKDGPITTMRHLTSMRTMGESIRFGYFDPKPVSGVERLDMSSEASLQVEFEQRCGISN